MSTHQALIFPRTDGDPSRWPDTARRPDDDMYYEEVAPSEPRHQAYEVKIGQYLAQKMNIPNSSAQKARLPQGYKVFAHVKKQHDGTWRTDYYLFGSVNAPKYRSTIEFQDHAAWLMDTSKPLDDHSQCACKYNSKSVKASVNRESLGSVKRPSSSSPRKESSIKRKKASAPSEAGSEDGQPSVVPERADELRSQRRFRRGELVWFKTDDLVPPAHLSAEGAPTITHWPGLIANVAFKSRVVNTDGTASASSSTAWTSFGGSAPDALAAKSQTIVHYHEYHIRPLGMFSPQNEMVLDSKDMIPWAIGNELLGGPAGWESIGNQGERVLKEGVKTEAEADRGKQPAELESGLVGRWRERWAPRIRFRDLGGDYDKAAFRLSIALNTAHTITQSWTQTDKIDVLFDDTDISAEDLQAIMSQKKTLYQGVWWGGERIWLEDMVRLKKSRSDLPTEGLLAPSDGALDRAVFMKVRVIAIEVSSDHTAATETAWRCILYGDVYELAKAGSEEDTNGQLPTPLTASTPAGDLGAVLTYTAPKGFVYRQLNDPGSEVTCDVIDVAGRVYPDLVDASTQNWYIDPDQSGEKEEQKQEHKRVAPGESVLALMGLKMGTLAASNSVEWKEDLYSIVQSASKTNEKHVRDFYLRLLREELGLPTATPSKTNGKENEAASSPVTPAASTLATAMGGKA